MTSDKIKQDFKADFELYGMKDAVCNVIDKLMEKINNK